MLPMRAGFPHLGPLPRMVHAHHGPPHVHGLRVRTLRAAGPSRVGRAEGISSSFSK
jgi:hypothetical protein